MTLAVEQSGERLRTVEGRLRQGLRLHVAAPLDVVDYAVYERNLPVVEPFVVDERRERLHDGAVVVREGRIAAAGCVLPLTQSTNLSKELGMRHRAGIGLSEQSDAVVVIVSEETGAISVAVEGMLKRHLSASSLDRLLHSELIREEENQSRVSKVLRNLQNNFRGKRNEKNEKNN